MSLKDIAFAARKRWVIVAASTVLGLIIGLCAGLMTTAQFSAQTYVYVAGQSGGDDGVAYEGSLLAEQKARAYSEIVSGGSFGREIVEAVGGDPAVVAGQMSVSARADSSLIAVIATDPSPERAAALADAGAGAVVGLVGELERPAPGRPASVTAQVVEPATVPTEPVGVGTGTYVVLGLIMGLLVGLGGAVLRSTFDTTVGDSRELVSLLDAPVLGVVPRDPQGGNLAASSDRSSPVAEAFRQVRTSLGFVALSVPVTTVMITSAVEGEGKSTAVADLAIVLAQQGQSVVAVDADLRRPHLAGLFGMPDDVGLTNVLLGQLALEHALQSSHDGSVSVLGRGLEPPNPTDLLAAPALAALLTRLAERFDIVLIDAPPLLPVADAAILSHQCDGVILAVHAHRTSSRLVTGARQRLENASARLLGTVLTMSRSDVDTYRAYRPREPKQVPLSGGTPAEQPAAALPRRPAPPPPISRPRPSPQPRPVADPSPDPVETTDVPRTVHISAVSSTQGSSS